MTCISFVGNMTHKFTAIIERDDDGYVALCPELDIASQGDTVEQARDNLVEGFALFFETASPEEVKRRLRSEFIVTRVESTVGGTPCHFRILRLRVMPANRAS